MITKTEIVHASDTPAGKKNFGYPAPKQLAVPTDLAPDAVKKISEAVNPLVAGSFALYVKTKNFHWHVASSHFRDFHLLFDEHATQIFESIDVMAERMRRIGSTTIRSIGHVAELSPILDDNEPFVEPAQMVERLLVDNRRMAKAQRNAIEICDDNKDSVTANALQEILDLTERRIWFLYEMHVGGQNAR